MVVVEVCSNHTIVELLLNGKSLGRKSMSECPDRLFRWMVPFEAGTLTAKAGFDGQEVISELKTTSKATTIKLTSDKNILKANSYDVAHIEVQLLDENGLKIKTENTDIEFIVEGDCRWLGVDNGARSNTQDFQSKKITTSKGRCLAILQSKFKPGTVKVTARSEGYKDKTISIEIK